MVLFAEMGAEWGSGWIGGLVIGWRIDGPPGRLEGRTGSDGRLALGVSLGLTRWTEGVRKRGRL
jgi:hypothetical protein